MSQRSIRVNELLKREISYVLHTDFRSSAVAITITDVDISPDLRNGRIYYSVIGEGSVAVEAERFFKSKGRAIKQLVSKRVVLKYMPSFRFIRHTAMERGARLVDLLDEVDGELDESGTSQP